MLYLLKKRGWIVFVVSGLFLLSDLSIPSAQEKVPEDVSAYLTVISIKERSHIRKRSKPRVIYDVNSEITIKNTSDKTIRSPIRSLTNIIGAGCSDTIKTRVFSKMVENNLTQSQHLNKVSPGESFTVNLKFEKQANIEISYEIITFGIVESPDQDEAKAKGQQAPQKDD
jgi:competence protein ComGF